MKLIRILLLLCLGNNICAINAEDAESLVEICKVLSCEWNYFTVNAQKQIKKILNAKEEDRAEIMSQIDGKLLRLIQHEEAFQNVASEFQKEELNRLHEQAKVIRYLDYSSEDICNYLLRDFVTTSGCAVMNNQGLQEAFRNIERAFEIRKKINAVFNDEDQQQE